MGKGIKGEEIKKRGNKNQILRGDATVDGTEITIRRDDWDMDQLYGKALAFGAPYSAARKLLPGITGAGFII
ncbi:hypothetical protein QMP26_23350 [Enterocloster clostridioformis]